MLLEITNWIKQWLIPRDPAALRTAIGTEAPSHLSTQWVSYSAAEEEGHNVNIPL